MNVETITDNGSSMITEGLAPPVTIKEDRLSLGSYIWLVIQLGLLLGVAVLYRIELERGFGTVAAVTFIGFIVHSWLPPKWRLRFFLLLTIVAIALLLRWNGIWLIALGLVLLGTVHLHVSWSIRIPLLVAAAVGLAFIQVGRFELSWASTVVPVLGAMFMFRIILYVYDLKTEHTHADVWQRLAYFFMLPNVCFPLFPVVDYKAFINNYYDSPAAEIYQKGLFWMLRGLAHLMLYRLVYLYFLPRADSDLSGVLGVHVDLSGILGVYTFMALTYALYLRVSGLFHLIVGMLCLFGFNLGRTNNNYFLASSFTDLWRRINIYWKDFMMTTVFYPVLMGLRRWKMNVRLVVATAAVFFVTWFLHSYQWFWLQGVFPLTGTDVAFWGILGAALAVNSVWEARRGRSRRLGQEEWSWRRGFRITAQTIAVFTMMAVLWTLWDSGSFADWGYRFLRVFESGPRQWMQFAALIGFIMVIGVTGQALASRGWGLVQVEQLAWRHSSTVVPVIAIAMIAAWLPSIHARIGGPFESAVILAKSSRPNAIDKARQERGYYETLSRTSWLDPLSSKQALQVEEEAPERYKNTPDVRRKVLIPDLETTYLGNAFSTNQWGMRDRDYELRKPPGTYRIALIGSSYVMGGNVADDETFENLLEYRLNSAVQGSNRRYEILNFAVSGYGLLQTLYVAERIVPRFDADLVMYVVQPREGKRFFQRLRKALEEGIKLGPEYDYLETVLRRVDAHGQMPESEFIHRLQPHQNELLRWAFQRKIAAIRASGAVPVFLYMPQTDTRFERSELSFLSRVAEESGARNLFINDVFEGQELDDIRRAEWDDHPNALGHRLIADRIYAELVEEGRNLGIFSPGLTAGKRPTESR